MLMSRRVIHNVRPVCLKDFIHPPCIPHRGNEHRHIQRRIGQTQFLLNIIGVIFVNIKNNQLFRLVRGDLTAQLASNGTAAAGYKHCLILDIP